MMSSEESLEVRQKNELEALEGIYGEDLKDLRGKPVWNKWVPLNLSLSLTPQQGGSGTQEIHAKIDLHIICSDKYPNSVPKILLENSKGLSNTVLVELQEKLEQRAEELKGEEMIFQLCQYVEEFLPPYNKPTSKSFYDEMLERQKEKEQMDMQAKQLEQDRQRKFMIEEVQRRQEILKSETRLRREHRLDSENKDDCETNRRFSFNRIRDDGSAESTDDSSCQHKGTAVMAFGSREIQRGCCIKHSTMNHIVFNGIDKESGELVIVSEWNISVKNKKDLSTVQRQISSIEHEINYLTGLKHSNLAHYYNMKSQTSQNKVIVYILKEFIYGSNCFSLFLSQNIKIDLDFLKHIAKGILLALDYLHRNNVIHKEIRDTNVYLNDAGIIKLSNYSIHRRLFDLASGEHGTYSKKTDIYNFGKLLLSLLQGSSISDENLEIPSSIHSDLYDFLTRCLATDEANRHTTTQLLNHPFFHKEIVPSSPQHAGQVTAFDRNVSPEIHSDLLLMAQSQANGKSRINNEFEFLQFLGKGAFGDVRKVKNKLDGGYYAIKRIQLNPKNRTLNKKILREVKLLSRLNHENVVRYYNSWIETTTDKEDSDSSPSFSSVEQKPPQVVKRDEFTLTDDVEAQAPSLKNVSSITYDSKSQAAFDSSSDDDSSDDDGAWGVVYGQDSDSDGIEFEHDSKSPPKEESSVSIPLDKDTESPDATLETVTRIDYMYIQMEFCEKSTLRTAIDDGLCGHEDRLWKMIREIVEGLAHIHQQGMIHRDLKPVNIFLDSHDHVKIGDFGLATTMIKSRQNEVISRSSVENEREEAVDESKTGLIGTALYVAPEISTAAKVVYNQKVDIYSLGIIFFEMCYKPLTTSMERIKVLTRLRMEEIIFPDDFNCRDHERKRYLIRWLLNHDISKRPSSQELLQSAYVPPVVEDQSIQESINHALSSPQLKAYKYLVASCFKQSVAPAQDMTYDKDPSAPTIIKPLQLYDFVKNTCIKIFRRHGGQNLSMPVLMPKSGFYEGVDSCVKLMTHFGTIVSLPHDLRVPFARYVAYNGITSLRRYSIERVYREKKVFGFEPRELYECAFDIVSSTKGNLMSDAEVLYIVHEIINELPGVKNKHFLIRLNHTDLLKAILLHCGVKNQAHEEVYNMIADTKEGRVHKNQLEHYFITLGLTDNAINLLLNLFNSEFEVLKAENHFHMITKKKTGNAGQLAGQALEELKNIRNNAVAYGVKFEIVVSPGLVYNVKQYSGMICQFVCELKKKHKHGNMEVLAAGGRYDSMISWYRSVMDQANILGKEMHQSAAVGISISLDRLVQAVQKEQSNELPKIDYLDAVVCSVGTKQLNNQRTQVKILRSLWTAGIKCIPLEEVSNMEDVNLQANELKVPHIIMLKDNDQGTVIIKTIRSWEKNLIQEKQCSISELVEQLQRSIKERNEGYQENVTAISTALSRSESKTACGDHCQEPKVEISFVTADKLSSNARKRSENQIRSQLDGLFKKLTGDVIVLGLSIESNVIRTLASYLEFDSEPHFQKTVEHVIERHQRHKKYLNEACDKIYDHKSKNTNPTVVLYSLSDNFFKVIF